MAARPKRVLKEIDVVLNWCKDHGITYSVFQQLESLGYLKVIFKASDNKYVRILNKERVFATLNEIRGAEV